MPLLENQQYRDDRKSEEKESTLVSTLPPWPPVSTYQTCLNIKSHHVLKYKKHLENTDMINNFIGNSGFISVQYWNHLFAS